MYIFNENGKNVEVYSMEPNKERVEEYKRNQIKDMIKRGIPIVYGIETNLEKNILEYTLRTESNNFHIYEPLDIPTKDINFEYRSLFFKKYHHLIANYIGPNIIDKQSYIEGFINSYIANVQNNLPLVRTFNYNDERKKHDFDKHLIFRSGLDYQKADGHIYISNIISLTKPLYIFELLHQGHYDLIDENVDEQVSLFDISKEPIKIIRDGEIKELCELGLVSGLGTTPAVRLARQVESSKRLIKYIK